MNALNALIEAGLHLRVDGDRLLVSPVSAITDPLRALIRQHKPELVAGLRAAHTPAPVLPFRLSKADADRCHYPCWNDAEIETFVSRVTLFIRHRVSPTDADDLSERLHLRDRDDDDRRLCLECAHYRPGRCGNHQSAGIGGPALPPDLATTLQRCPGFAPPGDIRQPDNPMTR